MTVVCGIRFFAIGRSEFANPIQQFPCILQHRAKPLPGLFGSLGMPPTRDRRHGSDQGNSAKTAVRDEGWLDGYLSKSSTAMSFVGSVRRVISKWY